AAACDVPAEWVPLLKRKTVQYLLVFAAVQLGLALVGGLLSDGKELSPLYLALGLGNFVLFLWNWCVYVRDIGVAYERKKAVIGLVAVTAVSLFGLAMLVTLF